MNNIKSLFFLILILFLNSFESYLFSQESIPDSPINNPDDQLELTLPPLLIEKEKTLEQSPLNLEKSAAPFSREIPLEQLTDPDIETTPEKMAKLPSVSLKSGNKGESEIRIRGARKRDNALFFNRIPMPNFYSSQADPTLFAPSMIEKLTLLKGASDPLLGGYGSGAAILVQSAWTKEEMKLSASIGTSKARFLYHFISKSITLFSGIEIKGKYSFQMEGSYNKNIPTLLNSDSKRDWINKLLALPLYGYTIETASLPGMTHYLDEKNPFKVNRSFIFHQNGGIHFKKGRTAGAIEISHRFFHGTQLSLENKSKALCSQGKWNEPLYNLTNHPELIKAAALRLRLFKIHYQNNLMLNPWIEYKTNQFELYSGAALFMLHEERTGYGNSEKTIGKNVIQFGANFSPEAVRDQLSGYSFNFLIEPKLKFLEGDDELSFMARWQTHLYQQKTKAESKTISPLFFSYHQNQWVETSQANSSKLTLAVKNYYQTPKKRFKLTAGLSYDLQLIHSLKSRKDYSREITLYDKPDSTSLIGGDADAFNPSIQIEAFLVPQKLSLNLSGGMRSRFPAQNEYMKLMQESESSQLQPETAYLTDASLSWKDNRWQANAGFFFSLTENPIIKPGGGLPPINSGMIMINGVELSLQYQNKIVTPDFGLKIGASYLFQDVREFQKRPKIISEGSYRRLELTPSHLLHIYADFIIKKRHILSIDLHSEIDQIIYSMESRPPLEGSCTQNFYKEIAAHNPVWLNLKYRFKIKKELEFYLSLKNIVGDYNPDPFRPGQGHSLTTGIQYIIQGANHEKIESK